MNFNLNSPSVAIIAEKPETLAALFEAASIDQASPISTSDKTQIAIPTGIKTVVICSDLDKIGLCLTSARDIAKNLLNEGFDVFIITPDGPVPEERDSVDFVRELQIKGPAYVVNKIKNARPWRPILPKQREFLFEHLSTLIEEPDEQEEWLVEGLLLKSGISMLAGKPKAGKTTLARQLAFCVSRGQPFLGFPTLKGSVMYLALEEKRNEVKKHFAAMGATGEEEIYIHAAAAPKNALEPLRVLMNTYRPTLVIIDPLFRFTRVSNSNDYSEVTNALEGVVALSRETDAHILLVHHMGKGDRDGADGILGSTAIFGAVDAALMMNRTGDYRSIKSVNRYGADIEERVLNFDAQTRTMNLGSEKQESMDAKVADSILKYLAKKKRACSHTEVMEGVHGNKAAKVSALNTLVSENKVLREGEGKKGSSFQYSIAEALSDSILCLGDKTESQNGDDHISS